MEYLHDYDYRELLAEIDELGEMLDAMMIEEEAMDWRLVEMDDTKAVFANSLDEIRVINLSFLEKDLANKEE